MKRYLLISLLIFSINAMHFSPKTSLKKQNISSTIKYDPTTQSIIAFCKVKKETILVTKCLKTKTFSALSTTGEFVSNAQNTRVVNLLKKHINQYEKNLNQS